MKKLLSIVTIVIGFVYVSAAQTNKSQVGNPSNYKAQNNRLSPGVDEPVFDGSKMESNEAMANASYKNQFSKTKSRNSGNGNLFLLPENERTNETGFYAEGYSKSGFKATRRKSNPAPTPMDLKTDPGTAQE